MSGGQGGNPWAWAGLLKWTLNHVDGTKDNSDIAPMSDEDREFLEKVMKEGIIDEGERMKFILEEASKAMEHYRSLTTIPEDGEEPVSAADPPIQEDALEELLQELRDIVEQIDYARAFCSLQGLPFLLGCVQQQPEVPESIRLVSLGILATVGQNNPPVQQQLLEMGAIKTLSDLFFEPATTNAIKAKIMQSMSSMVRNLEVAENVFSNLPQAPALFVSGLQLNGPISLRSKTLFFLRALVTSDLATPTRIQTFQDSIVVVRDYYLTEETPPELREMAIALLEKLVEDRKGGARLMLYQKDALAAQGVQRIGALRALTGDDREFAQTELEHWENFLVLLARAEPEEESKEEK